MKRITGSFLVLMAVFFFAGCASAPQVSYGNPEQVETVTSDFGSTDLQMIAEKMVNSLLASPVLSSGARPVFYVHRVRNMTDEHIDTRSITDKMRVTLLKSGRVRFSAVGEVNDEILKQLEYQSRSGWWTRPRPGPRAARWAPTTSCSGRSPPSGKPRAGWRTCTSSSP